MKKSRQAGKTRESSDSRRAFLVRGAATVVSIHPAFSLILASVTRGGPIPAGTRSMSLTLKTAAQYQSEGAQYESATRSLANAATISLASTGATSLITSQVTAVIAALAHHQSWMITAAMADAALQAWVRQTLRTEAALQKFVDDVSRDPNIVDAIAGVAALRAKLAEMTAAKKSIFEKIALKELEAAGVALNSQRIIEVTRTITEGAGAPARECQMLWAIVTAMLAVVAANVGSLTAAAAAAARSIAARYANTGADRSAQQIEAANQRYQQCIIAATTLPPAQREAAIATCQATLMQEIAAATL